MGQAVQAQRSAVVTRSRFNLLRGLLAVALIAVIGLTAAVVILAGDSDQVGSTSAARPIESTNYRDFDVPPGREWMLPNGTPDRALSDSQPKVVTGSRYDGGPEEGTRGAVSPGAPSNDVPGTRYDGGPEEGSRGSGR